jgi:hypothetical protein
MLGHPATGENVANDPSETLAAKFAVMHNVFQGLCGRVRPSD